MKTLKHIPLDQIYEGQKIQKSFRISADIYEHFLQGFSDHNPLHIDEPYAVSKGFLGKVMHGAILNGFISNFIGMEFPGYNTVIQSVNIDFKQPNYLDDQILLEGEVEQKVESVRTIVIKILVNNLTQNYVSARAKVQVGIL